MIWRSQKPAFAKSFSLDEHCLIIQLPIVVPKILLQALFDSSFIYLKKWLLNVKNIFWNNQMSEY